ncbi:MAG: hypothetical protein J6D16_02555 [Clostridia bacterium]|nr:hypothetical protein [Clostridia bacterium]
MRKNIRISNLIENLVFLLSVNIVQLATTYYHHRTVGEYRTSDIVLDALFAVIYAGFFIIVFFKNKTLFSEGSLTLRCEKNKFSLIIRWLGLIALKGAFDVILIYIGRISAEWKYIGSDFFVLSYWCLVYLIATKKISLISKNKNHLFDALIVIIIAVGLAVFYDAHLIGQYRAVHQKYTEVSPYFVRVCRNLDHLHSVKTFILDTFIACVLIVFHMTNAVDPEKKNNPQRGDGFRVFMRCNLIASLFAILFVIKMGVDPLGVLYQSRYRSNGDINYEEEGPFDYFIESKGVIHGLGKVSEDKFYYLEDNISLQKGDRFEQFTFAADTLGTVFSDTGNATRNYTQFSVDGKNVYLYGNYAICYYENNIPVIIRIDSLNQQTQNSIVTNLLKHLLEQGNLFVFEFGSDYLTKYEAEFIEPYIERYANGTFTVTEKEWLTCSYYREDYIIDIAKKLIT